MCLSKSSSTASFAEARVVGRFELQCAGERLINQALGISTYLYI